MANQKLSTTISLLYVLPCFLYTELRWCLLCLIKKNSKNSNLDDSNISSMAFLSLTNLKMLNVPVTTKLVKKALTNLDLSKVSATECIPVLRKCEPKTYIVSLFFNICLKESFFPDCWKFSFVVPVLNAVGGEVYG